MTTATDPDRWSAFRPPDGDFLETPGATEALERLADAGATGALHTGTGTVYLVAGAVVHAESHAAPGLAQLLAACGRIPPDLWESALGAAGPERRSGRLLVDQHLLTEGELELCQLSALYDAAFFALGGGPGGPTTTTVTFFEPQVRHWLGTVSSVPARSLQRSMLRRREFLHRTWPRPETDTSALVRPTPCRIPRSGPAAGRTVGRVAEPAVGPRQRALLDHIDGRRTPADLALLLGRSAYATTLEVRRLAAAGLVVSAPACGLQRRTPGAGIPAPPAADGPPVQARRTHPRHSRHQAAGPLSVPDPDVALLTRVLTALEARL